MQNSTTKKLARIFQISISIFIIVRWIFQVTFQKSLICGVYCQMAINYDVYITNRSFDSYFMQKSLNSLFAHIYILMTPHTETITQVNDILLTISVIQLILFVVLWSRFCSQLNLHPSVNIVGLCMCILNPIIMVYQYNYWEIPDTTLLLIGITILHTLINRNIWSLIFLFICSWLISPQVRIFVILLILFSQPKNRNKVETNIKFQNLKLYLELFTRSCKKLVKILLTKKFEIFTIFNLINGAVFLISNSTIIPDAYGMKLRNNWIALVSVPVSSLVQTLLLMVLLRLLNSFNNYSRINYVSLLGRCTTVILLELLRIGLVSTFGQGPNLAMTSSRNGQLLTLYGWFFESISFPGLFPLMVVNTFGLGMILIILFSFQKYAHNIYDTETKTIILALIGIFPLFANTQTRHLIFLVPIIIFLFLRDVKLSRKQTLYIMGLYIVHSRFFVFDFSVLDWATDWFGLLQGPWAKISTYLVSCMLFASYLFITRVLFPQKFETFRSKALIKSKIKKMRHH